MLRFSRSIIRLPAGSNCFSRPVEEYTSEMMFAGSLEEVHVIKLLGPVSGSSIGCVQLYRHLRIV